MARPLPASGKTENDVAANLLRQLDKSATVSAAVVKLGDEFRPLAPDAPGIYPRVYLEPRQLVSLTMAFPQGEPGDKIAVESQDGGTIGEKGPVKVLVLDEQRRLSFTFQPTENTGINRVTVRTGQQLHELNFWVGPELVYDESRVIVGAK